MPITSRGSLNFPWHIGYLLGPLDVSALRMQNWQIHFEYLHTTYKSIDYWMSCTCHKTHEMQGDILELVLDEVMSR